MNKNKMLAIFLAVLVLVISLTALFTLSGFAENTAGRDYVNGTYNNNNNYGAFDSRSGRVRDGEADDDAGVIGDEDGQVLGVSTTTDTRSDATFWGIVIALAVAAAIIILVALLVPRDTTTNHRD